MFTQLNDQTVLLLTIQFSLSHSFAQIKCQTVLFDLLLGPCQVLLLWVIVDSGVMVTKEYSVFPKAPALLEPHHQIVKCHIQVNR